jgi:hypothetical protein
MNLSSIPWYSVAVNKQTRSMLKPHINLAGDIADHHHLMHEKSTPAHSTITVSPVCSHLNLKYIQGYFLLPSLGRFSKESLGSGSTRMTTLTEVHATIPIPSHLNPGKQSNQISCVAAGYSAEPDANLQILLTGSPPWPFR